MEGLGAKQAREDSLLPLIIPVSVPVRKQDPSSPDSDELGPASSWLSRPSEPGCDNHKPSVIVTRRRSLRNSLSESPDQVGASVIVPVLSRYLIRSDETSGCAAASVS